jgi:hypothetical protein
MPFTRCRQLSMREDVGARIEAYLLGPECGFTDRVLLGKTNSWKRDLIFFYRKASPAPGS